MFTLVNADMVLLNVHYVTDKYKVNMDAFLTYSKNRNMSRVLISTVKHEAQHVIKIKEGDNEDEFILVKHDKFKLALNVLSIYGKQEGRSQNKTKMEKWTKFLM